MRDVISYLVFIFLTYCRTFLYCGYCCYVFSISSDHRVTHKAHCCTITVCLMCNLLGPPRKLTQCSCHPQPICVSRHEMNMGFKPVLEEFRQRGRSTFQFAYIFIYYNVRYTTNRPIYILQMFASSSSSMALEV